MHTRPLPAEESSGAVPSLSMAGSLVLGVLAVLLVWLGVFPVSLIQMIQSVAASL